MPATKHHHKARLPGAFADLVRRMPPRAIADDAHHASTVEMIDRLMAVGILTRGQEIYLETLVQLVQAYESARHAIETPRGIDTLRHLMEAHAMNASDLARLLGVHPSMGSKILKGDRALTVDHLKRLATKFHVRADTLMD